MLELIRAWQIGPRFFLDEHKAWAYAKELADRYSRNRPDAFNPKSTYLLRAELNNRTGYFLVNQLDASQKVIE